MNEDLLEKNGLNLTAFGGTEIMMRGLFDKLPRELLEKFQIIPSRTNIELDQNKVRILWVHDLPNDPMYSILKDGGWKNYHAIVFVSNWQMQQFIVHFGIEWSRCLVLQNAIEPIEKHDKPTDAINIAYWSTPHRGLQILVPVFKKLVEKHNNIMLHVFSSFGLYGWPDRDEQFKQIFEDCKLCDNIIVHPILSNKDMCEQLKNYHIMAYPSIWPETSCLCLMEAMSAGMLAIHPNFAALYETAANFTTMYQWTENINQHANKFYAILDAAINGINEPLIQTRLLVQKAYADTVYTWQKRALEWKIFLNSIKDQPTTIIPEQAEDGYFEYNPAARR
jgi:UDP-glucose:(glucosyl)LPS alpha-1,2-glucosyltransferase